METLSPQQRSSGRSCAFLIAIILIGQAIGFGASGFSPAALVFAALAIITVAIGICFKLPDVPSIVPRILMAVAIGGGFVHLAISDVFFRDPRSQALLGPFDVLAGIAATLAMIVIFAPKRAAVAAAFWILVAAHFLMSFIAVTARVPQIDVYVIQSLGSEALVHGHDPYAITFPNVYPNPDEFYPPGVVADGRVQCGYFYPPLSLVMDLPAFLIGDVRYAHLLALTLSVLMIAYLRPGHVNYAAAVLVMFSPRIFYQLQVAWIEPLVLVWLIATVFFAIRRRNILAAITLGLFLVAKQYAIFAAPAVLLLLDRPLRWREILRWAVIAAIAGTLVTLPFVLWDRHAFLHSMTTLYVGNLRFDSISFLPTLAKWMHWPHPPLAVAAIAAIVPIALTLWRAPKTAGGFAASVALILMCAFAFSPVAFGNYYFLAASALCSAVAAETNERSAAALRSADGVGASF